MDRLTDRSKVIPLPCAYNALFWARVHEKLARYEDTEMEPEECAKYAQAEKQGRYIVLKEPRSASVHSLEEIARADIEGRLLVLPCKVGDTVWRPNYDEFGIPSIDKGTVYSISIDGKRDWFSARYISGSNYTYTWDVLGETVFLTREDAEKALEGTKNDAD